MPTYLSDAWVRAANEALRTLAPLPAAVRVAYRVLDGPNGSSTHRLVLGPHTVSIDRESTADVTLTMAWPIAVAIHRGEVSAQRALLDGRIDLAGDPGVLLGHQERMAAIDDRLAALRADTDDDPAPSSPPTTQ